MCDYNTCCRLCLNEAKDGLNCLNVPRIISAIRLIFGFEITTEDKCSTKICQECMEKITNLSMYRDFVLNNQTTIKDYQIFRSNIQTLKNETIISGEDDLTFLDEDKPTEEPSNIRNKILRKKSPILTKPRPNTRKRTGELFPQVTSPIKLKKVRVLCERIDFNKDKRKIIINHNKNDLLEATSEKESVNRLKIVKTVAIGKEGDITANTVLKANTKSIDKKNDQNILKNTLKNNRKSVEINHTESISEKQQESPLKVLPPTECENNITTSFVNISRRLSVVDLTEKDNELPPTKKFTNINIPNIGINKTGNATPRSPVDSNSIGNEVKDQRATMVSSDNKRTSIEISKSLNETSQLPGIDSNLIAEKGKEQSARNCNGESIGIRKTPESKLLSQNNTSETPKQKEKELTPSSNIVSSLLNKTITSLENNIKKNLSVPTIKKQKLEINSAPVSTQNMSKIITNISQKTSPNAVSINVPSTSKVSPSLPISKPITIVHAMPSKTNLKFSAVQTLSINPSTIVVHPSQIVASNHPQQKQKVVRSSVTTTNANTDSEYVSLETYGQQLSSTKTQSSNVLSTTSSQSKPQIQNPLNPRFDRLYQQRIGGPQIQSVAPNNITSPGINTHQNSNKAHNTSSTLNSNKVKVLTVNQVNNSYLFKPALSTASAVKTVHLPYTNTGSTSHNINATTSYNSTASTLNNLRVPTSFNSTGQTLFSIPAPPYGAQQNVNMHQSNIASQFQFGMCNTNNQQTRLPTWNRNVTQNTRAVPNLNYSSAQDQTFANSLTFSIRLMKCNNEIQIKISNKDEEMDFNNMNKFQRDAVRKSMLQPSSLSKITMAFKAFKPDVYSKELLKKLGIESYFPKI